MWILLIEDISSNVNEVIRAVLVFFLTKRFCTHKKALKALKALKAPKAQRPNQVKKQNANKQAVKV